MIDDKKVFGLLQAKALGCLDEDENIELQNFINEGFVFPWDELGIFQNTAALLPLALQLEIPEPELKDRIALKLIKLTEELRAKKSIEEEQQKTVEPEEIIEEEIDEVVDEFSEINETFEEPPIEIETDIDPVVPNEIEDLNTPLSSDDLTFNLDDIELPGFESVTTTEPALPQNDLEALSAEPIVNTLLDEPQIAIPEIEELKVADVWIEPEPIQQLINTPEIPEVKSVVETKLVEETEDQSKPDFTKKSVAEKAFKTLEQDFDRLKYHFDEHEKRLSHKLLIAYIIIGFLAALLVVFFFKFNSDIESQQKEIDFLKSRPTSFLNFIEKDFASNLFS